MDKIDTRTKLSALCLFTILNIVFRGIHQMTLKSHLEMLLTGIYDGIEITENLMLVGGFLVEVPIAMVLFSLLLNRKIGRHGRCVPLDSRADGIRCDIVDRLDMAQARARTSIGRQGRQNHRSRI